MRQVYAHQATLAGHASAAAVAAALRDEAVTVLPSDDPSRLRILFATEPHRVDEVRGRIDAALTAGDWQLIDSGCTRVEKTDRPHARRLLHTR